MNTIYVPDKCQKLINLSLTQCSSLCLQKSPTEMYETVTDNSQSFVFLSYETAGLKPPNWKYFKSLLKAWVAWWSSWLALSPG